MNITYLGSAGFILEFNNKKIIIDAPYDDFVGGYEVPIYTSETESLMTDALDPFNNFDLFLISHAHRGHFDHNLVAKCFSKNESSTLVSTQGVYNELENNADNFDNFKERIFVPSLAYDESMDTTVNEIPLRLTRSTHWGGLDLLNIDFNINNIQIAFILEQDHYEKDQDVDILFCNSLTSALEPKHIMLCHHSGTNNIQNLLAQSQALPDVTFLTISLESINFTKEDDEISISVP